jgi:hypothetical protein
MHASYGRAFEWYCSELARGCESEANDRRVWLDWDGSIDAPTGQSIPDAIIQEGSTLFVVEMTTSAVTPAVSVSCDPEMIEHALTSVWFGRSPKLRQLASAWAGVKSGAVRAEGLDSSKITAVVPLLVSLRYVPLHLGLWHWYRDVMSSNGLSQEFVEVFRIMDVEDWEEFCNRTERRGMFEDFNAWQKSRWGWTAFEDWRTGTIGERPIHPRVAEEVSNFWSAISSELGMKTPLRP